MSTESTSSMLRPIPMVLLVMSQSIGTALAAAPESAGSPEPQAAGASASASADPRERAQVLFTSAMDLFDSEKYEDALENFRSSYELVPSPNSRLMSARCLRQMGRMPEAYDEYDLAILEAREASAQDEKYAQTMNAARDELAEVRKQVALVMVILDGEPPEGTRLSVAGREIERASWKRSVATAPGTIQVVLEGKGIARQEQELELNGGAEGEVEFHVEFTGAESESVRDADRRGGLRRMSYIAGGVGAVGLVTFGIVALADGSDALKYAGLGLGVAGVATGVVLFTLSLPGDSPSQKGGEVSLVVGPGSAGLVGSF